MSWQRSTIKVVQTEVGFGVVLNKMSQGEDKSSFHIYSSHENRI